MNSSERLKTNHHKKEGDAMSKPNISLSDHVNVVIHLNEAKAILSVHRMPTRSESLTITKIEEAIMWLERGDS